MSEPINIKRPHPTDEWRVFDEDFARKIGYDTTPDGIRAFRKLIRSHEKILSRVSHLHSEEVYDSETDYKSVSNGKQNGRNPGSGKKAKAFWLTESQMIFIGGKSNMPNADEGVILVAEAFVAYKRGDFEAARLYGAAGGELLGLAPRDWKKVYDDDFATLVHNLGNWRRGDGTWNSQVAHFINRYVYVPLFGELGHKALCEANPMLDSGSRAVRQHQWLKEKHLPRLLEHIGALKLLMRNAVSLQMFDDMFNRAFPQKNTQIGFLFDERRPS